MSNEILNYYSQNYMLNLEDPTNATSTKTISIGVIN